MVAERICSAVYTINIPHKGAKERDRLTVSVGASVTTPRTDLSLLDSIELADAKLYEAKEAGRNCWRSALCDQAFAGKNEPERGNEHTNP